MSKQTNSLLAEVLAAHGGLDRWHSFKQVSASVVSGGFLWGMKGMPLDATPRRMTSRFRDQWTRTEPFGQPGWHMTYRPARVVIETQAGASIAELENPRETFAGHAWETPWTPLQLGYFNGYAMWTYYNLPFILSEPGFEATEIPVIALEGAPLRGLRIRFPAQIHTHCQEQSLYFDEHGLLRRQDYDVDVAGKGRAAHLISDYVEIQGLRLPRKRRVYLRNEDNSLRYDRAAVTVDLSNFQLS